MEDSGQLQAPAASPPRKNTGTYWTAGWVGPRADRMLWKIEKSLAPARSRTLDRQACSLISIPTNPNTAGISGFRMWQAIL
jgi:hypothetical protein